MKGIGMVGRIILVKKIREGWASYVESDCTIDRVCAWDSVRESEKDLRDSGISREVAGILDELSRVMSVYRAANGANASPHPNQKSRYGSKIEKLLTGLEEVV